MEEYILDLFWEKITELPIKQIILITNKETPSEEIHAFFHRAILCNYNILFVVEKKDSFSEYQQSIMNNYIGHLLSYKNKKYNEDRKEDSDKSNTYKYLDSYIVFFLDKQNKNITAFLNEIIKFTKKDGEELERKQSKKRNATKDYFSELKNVLIINSDICGLGKSEKKMIKIIKRHT